MGRGLAHSQHTPWPIQQDWGGGRPRLLFLTQGPWEPPPLPREGASVLAAGDDSTASLPAPSQLFYDPAGCGLRKTVFVYFSDFWNKLDIAAILLFIAGLTCRWVATKTPTLSPGGTPRVRGSSTPRAGLGTGVAAGATWRAELP